MNDDIYLRSIEDLEKIGSKWWPKEVRDEANKVSILHTLLDTQEEFISILRLANRDDAKSIFRIIETSNFPIRCFLRHLMILTDMNSVQLQRLNKKFAKLFPNGKMVLTENESYYFHVLPIRRRITDETLKLEHINKESAREEKHLLEDLIILLLYHVKISNELCVADFIKGSSDKMSKLKEFMMIQLIFYWSKHNHTSLWDRMKNKFHKICA